MDGSYLITYYKQHLSLSFSILLQFIISVTYPKIVTKLITLQISHDVMKYCKTVNYSNN